MPAPRRGDDGSLFEKWIARRKLRLTLQDLRTLRAPAPLRQAFAYALRSAGRLRAITVPIPPAMRRLQHSEDLTKPKMPPQVPLRTTQERSKEGRQAATARDR